MSARSGLLTLLLPDEPGRRALEETLADWREERQRAASAFARARTEARGWLSILRVMLGAAGRELVAPDAWRVFGWTVMLAAIIAALNPMAWAYASRMTSALRFSDTVALVWLLIPNSFALAFVFATALGPGQPRRRPVPALASALLSFLFMLVVLGWVTPAASQQFRIHVAALDAHPPAGSQVSVRASGSSELALQELLRKANGNPDSEQEAARRAISVRAALLLAAPTGFLLGLAVRKRIAGRTPWRVAQSASLAAMIVAGISANYLWPPISRLLPWPTAVHLERLNIQLWLTLAVTWIAVLVLVRVRQPEPGQRT